MHGVRIYVANSSRVRASVKKNLTVNFSLFIVNRTFASRNPTIMELFAQTVLEDTVKIHPQDLSNNYKNVIVKKLKEKYEGHCSKFGLIIPESIALESILRNEVELHSFHGFALYDVRFTATICNPSEGSIITANVVNMNSFAVLCYSGNTDDGHIKNAVEIIIPRQVENIINFSKNTIQPTDQIKIGDRVNVEIIGKKHQLGSKKIAAIGRLVDHLPPAPNNTTFVNVPDKDSLLLDDDDDADDPVIISEFGDDNYSDDGSEPSFYDDLAEQAIDDDGFDADRDLLKAEDGSDIDDD